MADCAVCNHELQEGYDFCHFCGTKIGVGIQAVTGGAQASDLVKLVDKFKTFSSASKDLAGSTQETVDQLLGSPVSIQRQIAYALLSGLAIACLSPPTTSLFVWLVGWLGLSAVLLVPVSYWTTGVTPFSGRIHQLLGPELSLRRRIIFTLLLGLPAAPTWGFLVLDVPLQANDVSNDLWILSRLAYFPLAVLGSFLTNYYMMGFATSWRAIPGCEFSISSKGLGEHAASLAEEIREAMAERALPALEVTRVPMAKLRHYSAGASSGTAGEQLSFISGKARMVVFVQDFGDSLFIRAAGFYDASGRRLWLLLGQWIAAIDRWILRWFGSSLLAYLRQWTRTLSPATRNQVLLRPSNGGAISRALRLTEGISEYSWNELFALAGVVRDAVASSLEGAVTEQEELKNIRSQLANQARFERMSSGSSGSAGHQA